MNNEQTRFFQNKKNSPKRTLFAVKFHLRRIFFCPVHLQKSACHLQLRRFGFRNYVQINITVQMLHISLNAQNTAS